jgi:hypothetical protein
MPVRIFQNQDACKVCSPERHSRCQLGSRRRAGNARSDRCRPGRAHDQAACCTAREGKRGGFRLLVGFGSHRSIFLFGFAKNERENIEDTELKTLREITDTFLKADDAKIEQALQQGVLVEVHYG